MPVSYLCEEAPGQSFSINELYQREYTRTFYSYSDDDATSFGPIQAYNAMYAWFGVKPGVYYQNSYGESDHFALCLGVDAEPLSQEKAKIWKLTAKYGPYNPNLIAENPLDVYPVASYSTVKREKPIDIDINGHAIVNSAGDPYDPAVTVDDSRSILTIRRNESTFDAHLAAEYKDKLNSDVFAAHTGFAGYQPKQVKVSDIVGEQSWNGTSGLYYVVTYTFELSTESYGWQRKVLDAGYRELDGSGVPKPIILGGQPVSSPACLDGSGHHLTPPPPTGTPVWNTYDVYDTIVFGTVFNFTNVIGL